MNHIFTQNVTTANPLYLKTHDMYELIVRLHLISTILDRSLFYMDNHYHEVVVEVAL